MKIQNPGLAFLLFLFAIFIVLSIFELLIVGLLAAITQRLNLTDQTNLLLKYIAYASNLNLDIDIPEELISYSTKNPSDTTSDIIIASNTKVISLTIDTYPMDQTILVYKAVFQLKNGIKKEFITKDSSLFDGLSEGDIGQLKYKEAKFICFIKSTTIS